MRTPCRARACVQCPLSPRRRGVPGGARLARVVPRRAVLPLRDGRARGVAARRDPPPAVAAAGSRRGDRTRIDCSGRASRRAALPFLAQPGCRDLAARGCALTGRVRFAAMTAQRRTALFSVLAAAALIGLKLGTGLATGSLGLLSEALHSGIDLIAALLTFFAVGVAGKPADPSHQYGHGKAEHLSALAEAAFLAAASVFIGLRAVERLSGSSMHSVHAAWYALVVVGVVIVIDVSRTTVSWRASRRYESAALASNAVHFGSDLAGSVAVLIGLVFARAGHPSGDSIAALFVAV